jgi:4-amino-4-deoxy-L-arabinose transferase-like glycosyltransferase
MTSPSLHPERRFRARLLIIVAVAAAWRVGVLIVDKWRQPLLLNDSLYYAGQAQQLARGIWFREIFVDQPGAEHGPLTSLVLAPVAGGSDPVPWMRLVTVLFGIVTVLLIGLLGRRVGGDRVGLVAAAIAAIYPNLWMNDGLVMSESVSVFAPTFTRPSPPVIADA